MNMKVLLLSPYQTNLGNIIKQSGDSVLQVPGKMRLDNLVENGIDFMVCYGCQHILSRDIIDEVHGQVINLHISFLPWNRGADPNFWSIVEGTPKGATIHYVDDGIDMGDIIVQSRIEFSKDETLATSYWILRRLVERLFIDNWKSIRSGQCPRLKQNASEGSFHDKMDMKKKLLFLPQGWDTSLRQIRQMGLK